MRMRRRNGPLLLVATALAIAGSAQRARAQDDAEPDEEQPAQPRPAVVPTDEVLNIWVFALPGGAVTLRSRLESSLQREVSRVDQMYGLTPEQMKKLELAGRGDIKRF